MASDQWDGLPQNPERDGWHLLSYMTRGGIEGREVFRWWARIQQWDGQVTPEDGWSYVGPMFTPADLSAAEAAAAREMREKCVQAIDDEALPAQLSDADEAYNDAIADAHNAVVALSDPAPGALERYVAAAVAEARREGMEEVFAALEDRHAHYLTEVERWAGKGVHNAANLSKAKAKTIKAAINAIRARGAEARQAGEVGDE